MSKAAPADPGKVRLTEEDLRTAWNAYAESAKRNVRAYNALISCKPQLGEDGKIKLEVATEAQREYFSLKVKPGLSAYLQEQYANIEYLFDIRISAAELQPKRAYTDEDKLQVLMRKNPDLERMKEIFKLDFDS